jgi:hypothetical protein
MVQLKVNLVGYPLNVLVQSPNSITVKGKVSLMSIETTNHTEQTYVFNEKEERWLSFYGNSLSVTVVNDTVLEINGDIEHFKVDPLEGKLRFFKVEIEKVSINEIKIDNNK